MAYRLPDSWLDDLRNRVNIVDVVSEYVSIKPKGRKYWGLCPFHNEKTASFSVSEDNQMFYCFGCHKGGSVIHFVMEIEHMEFMDAVTLLADKAHLAMPEGRGTGESSGGRELREKVFAANLAAAKYYHERLWTSEGAEGLKYLYSRGLTDGDIRKFGLGFADASWDGLKVFLTEQGFDEGLQVRAGLTGKKDDRAYDLFRGRIMFPIIGGGGQILGFGARAMGDDQPKYLNTSDTPVFNKRRELYAINFLRKERDIKKVLLVEGYMDVIALRRRGMRGVVATLGTALTEDQARLASRYSKEIWVCYDGDNAGQNATLRALSIFKGLDARLRVLVIPDNMDPDEYISRFGRETFESLKPTDPVLYQMTMKEKEFDLSDQDGRTQYAVACCSMIREVANPVERENFIKALALKTGFDQDTLKEQIGVAKSSPGRDNRPRTYRPREEIQEHIQAERSLILLLSQGLIPKDMISAEDFETPHYAEFAQKLRSGKRLATAIEEMDEGIRTDLAQTVSEEILPNEKDALIIAEDCIRVIRKHRIDRNIEDLKIELTGADGDNKRELTGKIAELMIERQRLMTGRKEWTV